MNKERKIGIKNRIRFVCFVSVGVFSIWFHNTIFQFDNIQFQSITVFGSILQLIICIQNIRNKNDILTFQNEIENLKMKF